MVRKALSLLPGASAKGSAAVYNPLAHDLAGAERKDSARRDRNLDSGLRVAADPLALVAQDEAAEARNLHVLAVGQRMTHTVEHALDDIGGLGPGEADSTLHDLGQIGAGQRSCQRLPDRTCSRTGDSPPPLMCKQEESEEGSS